MEARNSIARTPGAFAACGFPVNTDNDEFQFSVRLQPKQIVNTWAKLDAPPPQVKHVSLVMPGTPPFDNIPIQD